MRVASALISVTSISFRDYSGGKLVRFRYLEAQLYSYGLHDTLAGYVPDYIKSDFR